MLDLSDLGGTEVALLYLAGSLDGLGGSTVELEVLGVRGSSEPEEGKRHHSNLVSHFRRE